MQFVPFMLYYKCTILTVMITITKKIIGWTDEASIMGLEESNLPSQKHQKVGKY